MTTDINVFCDCDIYSVEEQDGKKIVHVNGYMSVTDEGRYYSSEQCWQMYPLEEIVALGVDARDMIAQDYSEYKNYEYETYDEQEFLDWFNTYDDGAEPQPLPYSKLTMDTPCGCYYDAEG